MAYRMKGHTLPGINQRSDEKMDLTKKTGLGPRAEVKKVKEDNVSLDPGFEDPIKIQKVQRKGITPNSQNFSKPKELKAIKSFKAAQLETEGSDERETIKINK